jgi:DNA-binding transcriptional ArsR family regulator
MIVYRFGHDDLVRTRFAISPLFEAMGSVATLRDPAGASLHLPWVRAARDRVAAAPALDLRMLEALVPPYGYAPDFINPPPDSPLPDVEAEIERVRAMPARQVRREIGLAYEDRLLPEVLRPLVEEPRRGLSELADLVSAYWARAIAPFWPEILAVLEDDIAHRARSLTAGGPIAVFGDLHPDVRWSGDALIIDRPYEAEVQLGGQGLQLVPSVFTWPRVGAMLDPPWQPAVIYPPRGAGALWEPARRDDGALSALLGTRRAALLAALDHEASTTTLARRLRASPAGVSEHLAVLRRAGLVRGRRQGREVLYARTGAGDALLRAPTHRPQPSTPSRGSSAP